MPVRNCEASQKCPVAAICCGDMVPCSIMAHSHEEKLKICTELEEIADTLPGSVDRLKCLHVANALVPLLRSSHQYEEQVIFPAYDAAVGPGESGNPSTRRLRAEHVEDECFGDEVTEALLTIAHGGDIENPEAVGFMLRGFFESMRRHIAFEREHVLPTIEAGPPI